MRWTSASVGISPPLALRARSRSESSFERERPARAELFVGSAQDLLGRGTFVRAREERAHAREDRRRGLAGELLVDDRLRERDEDARRSLEPHAKGADGVDDAREPRVGRAQVLDRNARIEAEARRRRRKGALPVRPRAFDREQAELRRDATIRGEAADLAAGREHAMARHDDRERVSPECLPYGARRAGRAEPRRDLAVRERRARRNGARHLVNAAVKRRHAIHVERDRGQIAGLAAEERDDAVERALHIGRRRHLTRVGKSLEQRVRASRPHAPPGAARRRRRARPT